MSCSILQYEGLYGYQMADAVCISGVVTDGLELARCYIFGSTVFGVATVTKELK